MKADDLNGMIDKALEDSNITCWVCKYTDESRFGEHCKECYLNRNEITFNFEPLTKGVRRNEKLKGI